MPRNFFKQFNITNAAGQPVPTQELEQKISQYFNNPTSKIRAGGVGTTGRVSTLADMASYKGNFFGTGSAGHVTYSGDTTLTEDLYAKSIIVKDGVTLTTGGYRVFAQEFIQVEGTGKIAYNGNNGSNGSNGAQNAAGGAGGSGGAALNTGTVSGSPAGGNGGAGGGNQTNGASGANGSAVTNALIGNGVQGGTGGDGGGDLTGRGVNPGTAGTASLAGSSPKSYDTAVVAGDINGIYTVSAGSSGGGGGGGGGNSGVSVNIGSGGGGGGAGSGGGIVLIAAPRVLLQPGSSLSATGGNGGNGGNGGSASGGTINVGGGGGGGGAGGPGGAVILVYSQSYQNKGVITVTGGSAGSGGTAGTGADGNGVNGTAGTAGPAGQSYIVQMS